MRKRLIRAILSIVLILCAVAGFVLWETEGREMLMTTEVLVAACDIQEGQLIEPQMLAGAGVLNQNVLAGHMKPGQKSDVSGRHADCSIKANQQITSELLRNDNYILSSNLAPCVIPGELILTMSSSIRKGDTVILYNAQGEKVPGEYKVAFAKDASNQEVVDLENPTAHKKILERTNSNAVLHHLEIEASADAYAALLKTATSSGGIVIIQKGDYTDE